MADLTYLSLRGRTWWYVRKIPAKLRDRMRPPHLGKALFRVNLKTSDLREAQSKRPTVNALFETETKVASLQKRSTEAEELMARADRLYQWVLTDNGTGEVEDRRSIAEDLALDERHKIEAKFGPEVAAEYWTRATGNRIGTPIAEYLEKFIAENPARPHTNYKRRAVINELAGWRSRLTCEVITPEVARGFVDERLAPGKKPATINSALGVLSTYWQWMVDRSLIPDRSLRWQRFRRKKANKPLDEKQRAFTQEEIVRLFHSDEQMRPDLLDFATVAALTGARQNEIGLLRVSDVDLKELTLFLPGEKTEAAARKIPLHPTLAPIFHRRVEGRGKKDWVFPELPERTADALKARSAPMSQAFTRFRRVVGVGTKSGRSPVDFHSFRRWFSTRMVEIGSPKDLTDHICGWATGDMRERYAWTAQRFEEARGYVDRLEIPRKV